MATATQPVGRVLQRAKPTLLDHTFEQLARIERTDQQLSDSDRRRWQAKYNQLLRRILWKTESSGDASTMAECIRALELTRERVREDLSNMRTVIAEEHDAANVQTKAEALQKVQREAQAVMATLRAVQSKVRLAEAEFQVAKAAWKRVSYMLPRQHPDLFVEDDSEATEAA